MFAVDLIWSKLRPQEAEIRYEIPWTVALGIFSDFAARICFVT